jgi:hypothetical protein
MKKSMEAFKAELKKLRDEVSRMKKQDDDEDDDDEDDDDEDDDDEDDRT